MRRVLSLRALHLLFALWFVLGVGEPSVLRLCPMHASAVAELASERDTPAAGMSGHEAVHEEHPSAAHHHAHHCNCVNCCVGCSFAALHSPHVAIGEPAFGLRASGDFAAPADAPRTSALHLLPPGTGPPRVQAGRAFQARA